MAIDASEVKTATAYEALGIDPCAPVDLISASYWNLVKELQAYRGDDPRIDTMLYHAMRAYETLSDPEVRKEYDASIGLDKEPLTRRKFQRAKNSRLSFLPGRNKLHITADPYEVMGLHPTTLQSSIPDAYRVMKQQYLRLPPGSKRRVQLLALLDTSYAVLNDPEKRAIYDEGIAKAAAAAEDGAAPEETQAEPTFEPILNDDGVDEAAEAVADVAAAEVAVADEALLHPLWQPWAQLMPPEVVADPEVVAEEMDATASVVVEGATEEAPVEVAPEPDAEAAEATADMLKTRYVLKETEPVVEEEAPTPTPPQPAKIPDPAPSQAGRLRRTKKAKAKAEITDDGLQPPPKPKARGPRRTTVEGDVEALMLSRLEARMGELAAFGGSSEPPSDGAKSKE